MWFLGTTRIVCHFHRHFLWIMCQDFDPCLFHNVLWMTLYCLVVDILLNDPDVEYKPWAWNIPGYLPQYHDCWWPGSLRRQVINNNSIDHTEQTVPCLLRERTTDACTISELRNNRKCSYNFMFLKIISGWHWLNVHMVLFCFDLFWLHRQIILNPYSSGLLHWQITSLLQVRWDNPKGFQQNQPVFTQMKCYFDGFAIASCVASCQHPVQSVMKISSKWHFIFIFLHNQAQHGANGA